MSNSHADSPTHYLALPASGHKASWTLADSTHQSHVDLLWENEGWTANGVLGSENAHYVIRMSALWVVQQFLLFRDLDEPDLWLATDGRGRWGEMNGEHRTELDGCIDIDLQGTPFTNSILTHRLPLYVGHSSTQNVITVDTETLGVTVVPQMYTRVDTHRWQYISLLQNKSVEVVVDEFGFVIDEPGAFSRTT
jgi:hypothetical protein